MAHTSGCGNDAESMSSPSSLETQAGDLRMLKTIPHVAAEGFVGNGDEPFFVQERTPQLLQFPCHSCHLQPLLTAETNPLVDQRTMHVDINLKHAGPEVMDCWTCHDPENLDHLHMAKGAPIGMNQTHQLCAQCHFEQARDWARGAHGKRVGGWRGKRVVMSCAGCHNPHQPAIEKQWPVTFPILPHVERKARGAKGHDG